jgi:hypothetical protein
MGYRAAVAQTVWRLATGWTAEVGAPVPVGSRILTSPNRPDRLWGHPVSYPVGPGGSFGGGGRPEREADHSSPVCAVIKKTWIMQPLPYISMA